MRLPCCDGKVIDCGELGRVVDCSDDCTCTDCRFEHAFTASMDDPECQVDFTDEDFDLEMADRAIARDR